MNYMIGSDFDGTLLKNGGISQTVRNQIRKFRENGNYFVIVTGRSVSKMLEGIEKYHVDFFDFILCSNGAVLLDQDLHVTKASYLDRYLVEKIIHQYANKRPVISTTEKSYSFHQWDPAIQNVVAVSFESENKEYGQEDEFSLFQNGKYVDIVQKGISKSIALLQLCEKLGVADQDLFTIGDGENDLDLLDCASFSFSFSYCSKTVRKHAKQCYDTIEEIFDEIENKIHIHSPLKLSLIIPTYNRKNLLEMTLQSLLTQTFPSSQYEVIICDDGSTDDTFSMIKNYVNQLNIQYTFHKNEGFRAAYTRNCGINIAKGEILIFIDSGMILDKNFVQKHFEIHHTSSEAILGVGRVLGFEKGEEIEKQIINTYIPHHIDPYLSKDFEDRRMEILNDTHLPMSQWPAPWVDFWSCNFSIKKQLIQTIGMFDESFIGWGGEDTDLAIRLHIKNVLFVFIKDAISLHYPHPHSEVSGFILEQRKIFRKTYLINKYNLPEMKEWLTVGSSKLNKYLLEKENKKRRSVSRLR